jgi:ABC-type polysaccharide/polyol phosphate transport system ATPase subunit
MTASVEAVRAGVRFLFDSQQRSVTPTLARLRRRGGENWGLIDATFSIGPGESVALLGPSGSGKTTLLRVIAGIVYPDGGTISVNGRIGSLLSIDAGLLSSLTGRENAVLLGVLAGLSRAESRSALAAVQERSGLEEAFDRPVSSFSQGMRARLGLTVAEEIGPEILLLDEVHEALDHHFRNIIAARARALVADGGIVIAAGHDHGLLEQFCERALWMRDGRVAVDGPFAEIRDAYLASE